MKQCDCLPNLRAAVYRNLAQIFQLGSGEDGKIQLVLKYCLMRFAEGIKV